MPVAASTVLLLLAASLVEDGKRFFQASEFARARAALERTLRDKPSDQEARFWLGFTLLGMGDVEAALRHLERIDRTYEYDSEYLFATAEAYTRRARELSDQLSNLPERSVRRHHHFARRHLAVGDIQNALIELRLAATANPKLPGLHLEIAEILWRERKFGDAASELSAELRLVPFDFLANLRYGQYLLQTGEAARAIDSLRTAARYRELPEAHQLWAYALIKIGTKSQAKGVIESGLRIFPGNPGLSEMLDPLREVRPQKLPPLPPLHTAKHSIASLRLRSGEHALFFLHEAYSARAEEYLLRLEKAAPGSARVLQVKALNAEYANDYARAESYYREALEKAPDTPGLRFGLGHVLRLQGKNEEAQTELLRETASQPRQHLVWFELGMAQAQRDDMAAAAVSMERSLELNPAFVNARTEMAKAYLRTGKAENAANLMRVLVREQPNHSSAHFLLGRAYQMMGKAELARKEFEMHRFILDKEVALKTRRK
jgi:predicted Zn-dependent protease